MKGMGETEALSSDLSKYRSLTKHWLNNYHPLSVRLLQFGSNIWAPSSEFVSSSIPSWQILTAHALPFRGARDLAFWLKVPLDSLLVWASSGCSGETARMRRLAWTFAARIGDKYQIRLTLSNYYNEYLAIDLEATYYNEFLAINSGRLHKRITFHNFILYLFSCRRKYSWQGKLWVPVFEW